jgi:hypothetical protein
MAQSITASGTPERHVWPQGLELAAFCFCVAQVAFLAAAYAFGHWLFDPNGARLANDFTGFWPAWRFVLEGNAPLLWDPAAHKAAANAVIGYDFDGSYPQFYPPHYMMVFAVFGLLPYTASYLVWAALNPLPYVYVIYKIIGDRSAILLAFAFPALLANLIIGQNGCITAALIGGALLAMERRPVLAGVLIGLVSFKPHFGILFPLALIASQQWRAFVSASVTVVALTGASWLLLGTGAWEGFVNAILSANQNTLAAGHHDWRKLQSVFGLVRVAGGGVELAWLLHGAAMLGMAVWACLAWAGRQPFAIKAAVLSAGALIAAPYAYMYDVMILAVPIAFLLRDGRERGFLPGEMPALAAACLLLASFPLVMLPVGVGAALIVVAMIARRWHVLGPRRTSAASWPGAKAQNV